MPKLLWSVSSIFPRGLCGCGPAYATRPGESPRDNASGLLGGSARPRLSSGWPPAAPAWGPCHAQARGATWQLEEVPRRNYHVAATQQGKERGDPPRCSDQPGTTQGRRAAPPTTGTSKPACGFRRGEEGEQRPRHLLLPRRCS